MVGFWLYKVLSKFKKSFKILKESDVKTVNKLILLQYWLQMALIYWLFQEPLLLIEIVFKL